MSSVNPTDMTIATNGRNIDQQAEDTKVFDLTVTVGDKAFACHRGVLASVSEYFKTALNPSWQEASSGRFDLTHEDVSPESFGYWMDYLYKGVDVVNNNTAKDILKMSVYLQIKNLEERCVEFLQKNLQPEVCLGTWQLAQKYDLDKLAETSLKMATDNFGEVSMQDQLLPLPKSLLLILLSLQQNFDMDDVCKTILRWVEADHNTRQIHLLELLPFICFTELSSSYLCDVVTDLNHPFKVVMHEQISEALTYYLKGQLNKNQEIKRRILARQPRLLDSEEIQNCVFMFGGYKEINKPIQDTYIFDLKKRFMKRYSLAPMPEDIGLDFASCTWYNEVYVSGGSELPTFFAVYKPGDNDWEVLPSLPDVGLESHAMAAVSSSIYVLGGFKKARTRNKISCDVLKYNTISKEWSVFCQLPLSIYKAIASTLGHRIYLFGGLDSNRARTDLVQCVDTLSGCTYKAGKLPSPTCGVRALSNGGHIYVVRPQCDVLFMRENFTLAEHIEKLLSDSNSCTMMQSTVSFKEVGKFSERQYFTAYLHAGEIIVCGGESKDQILMKKIESLSLADGKTSKKFMKLINGAAKFDLHLLNIPTEFVRKGTAVIQPFRVGDKVRLTPDEDKKARYNYPRGGGDVPLGIGTIKGIDNDSKVTVSFPNFFNRDWKGTLTQLQHVDEL